MDYKPYLRRKQEIQEAMIDLVLGICLGLTLILWASQTIIEVFIGW